VLGEKTQEENAKMREKLLSAIASTEKIILQALPIQQIKEFYYTFNRRLEALQLVVKYCREGSIVLDAGTEQGFHSIILKKMGYNVIAIDIDDQYAAFIRKNGIEFYRVNLEHDRLPFEDGSVDCILFTEVIEHLKPLSVPFTLSEFYRVLKPVGHLIITTPNAKSIGKFMRKLVFKQAIPPIHVKEYTMQELVELLTKVGFKISLTRFSLSTYLNPRKARKPQNYKGSIVIELFRTPHIENFAQFVALLIAALIP